MNFQLRRFIHNTRQYITFETFMMSMVLLLLVVMTTWGLCSAYKKYERLSRSVATGLTPAPADAEPKALRK